MAGPCHGWYSKGALLCLVIASLLPTALGQVDDVAGPPASIDLNLVGASNETVAPVTATEWVDLAYTVRCDRPSADEHNLFFEAETDAPWADTSIERSTVRVEFRPTDCAPGNNTTNGTNRVTVFVEREAPAGASFTVTVSLRLDEGTSLTVTRELGVGLFDDHDIQSDTGIRDAAPGAETSIQITAENRGNGPITITPRIDPATNPALTIALPGPVTIAGQPTVGHEEISFVVKAPDDVRQETRLNLYVEMTTSSAVFPDTELPSHPLSFVFVVTPVEGQGASASAVAFGAFLILIVVAIIVILIVRAVKR